MYVNVLLMSSLLSFVSGKCATLPSAFLRCSARTRKCKRHCVRVCVRVCAFDRCEHQVTCA